MNVQPFQVEFLKKERLNWASPDEDLARLSGRAGGVLSSHRLA
jgi:hypothetical protein